MSIDRLKTHQFGMFVHYGLYSIPAGVWKGEEIHNGYSEQILSHGPVDPLEYEALMHEFTAEAYDPYEWIRSAKAAGMTYIVLTTKHHDGFCLFDTKTTDYNSMKSAAGRDLVRELAEACRIEGMGLGFYYSWIDWNYPGAHPISDTNNDPIPEDHHQFNLAQLKELLCNYGPLCELWFDMGKPTKQQSREMAALVRTYQPQARISGRIWNNQEDFIVMGDNEIPDFSIDQSWQTPASIYHETWGYRSWQERDSLEEKVKEMVESLAKITVLGGSYLLNIGPTGSGKVLPFEQEVLRGIGLWLKQNEEAVFNVEPGPWEEEEWGYCSLKENTLYLQIHSMPAKGTLDLKNLSSRPHLAYLLSDPLQSFTIESMEGGYRILLPETLREELVPIIKLSFSSAPVIREEVLLIQDDSEVKGREIRTFQGEHYGDFKAVTETCVYTMECSDDAEINMSLLCKKGQQIKIETYFPRERGEKVTPLNENQTLKVSMKK